MVNTFLQSVSFNKKVHIRFVFLILLFLVIFNGFAILSYYLLPEGFLRGKNALTDFEISRDVFVSATQIFAFNLLPVLALVVANIFSFANKREPMMPLGYSCMAVLFILNGITLGTWSFTVISEAPGLAHRLLRTFDILNRAGLWEMTGQMLIASATARISMTKHSLNKTEAVYISFGLCLMLAGACIESVAIMGRNE